jgi:hypothetical protein
VDSIHPETVHSNWVKTAKERIVFCVNGMRSLSIGHVDWLVGPMRDFQLDLDASHWRKLEILTINDLKPFQPK